MRTRQQPVPASVCGGDHPRLPVVRQVLGDLTAQLPPALPRPALRVVAGPAAATHLHQRPGHPPEVRVSDQLLEHAPGPVLAGVLAHELAHLLNGDARHRRRAGLGLVLAVAALLAGALTVPAARAWLSPLTCLLGLVLLALSRQLELRADVTSLRLVDREQAAASLAWLQHDQHAREVSTLNRAWGRLDAVTGGLLSTHPTAASRHRALRRAICRASTVG